MRPETKSTNYKNLVYLLIPTFVLVLAWIGFGVYGSRVNSTISEKQSKRIKPISSTFDLDTVESLKNREKVTPLLLFQPIPDEDDEVASESSQVLPPIEPTLTPVQPDLSPPSSATEGGTTP